MPELPEVETVARGLQLTIAGRRIVSVTLGKTDFIDNPADLEQHLPGQRIARVERFGKFMLMRLSREANGDDASASVSGDSLLVHLGMTGRIVVTGPDGSVTEGGDQRRYGARPDRAQWSRFTIRFADGGSLVLRDPRRLGRVWLNPDIAALGPDAGHVTAAQFRALITRGTIAVKARLLDLGDGIRGRLDAAEDRAEHVRDPADDGEGELEVDVDGERPHIPEAVPDRPAHREVDGLDLDRQGETVR